MNWRGSQAESRKRHVNKYDAQEADLWDSWVGMMSSADDDAYLTDLNRVFSFQKGMEVLDVGAGTGALCKILSRLPGLSITALEPAPQMLAKLKRNVELQNVIPVEGFCDAIEDRHHFDEAQFDVIVSRQLVNGLFDPMSAFRNWHYWLSTGGAVIVIEGLYGRDAWRGKWVEEIDVLPHSACQTTALTPYLLETAGFRIDVVEMMVAVNATPSTKSIRYVVVARKVAWDPTARLVGELAP